MLSQGGIKNITVKIFDNADKYIDRLSQITYLDTVENKSQGQIVDLLYSISI